MADTKELFPGIPEDLSELADADVRQLLSDHEAAIDLIVADDEEFLAGLSGDEVIAQMEAGVAQTQRLRAHISSLAEAHENYRSKIEELKAGLEPAEEDEGDGDGDEVAAPVEVVAEAEGGDDEGDGDGEEAVSEERVLVTASADTAPNANAAVVRFSRTPPAPAPARVVTPTVAEGQTALVAAGEMAHKGRDPLDHIALAELSLEIMRLGPLPKRDEPGLTRFGGQEHKIARADYSFPEDRILSGSDDMEKIRAVLPETTVFAGAPGGHGGEALLASGGLCAPATPFYGMVNFGTEAEPVWDSLPVFQARRGAVNIPESTYIGDITSAISSISEANDALGGTFATKSCQDLECPDYTETAVQIFAHCREYGNLNARSWPEKIAHENAITMQALARTSEDFMLERIKALSINVTNGVETLGALIYLVDAIVKAAFGIRGRLRMPANARFRALLPSYATDLLLLDTIQTQFDRFTSRESLVAYLRMVGIDPVFYIDGNFAAGDDQLPDASQGAGAIDGLPNTVQWALYPEGAFLGIDMGTLELGIVRDSVLNSTNDFQVFGERFRNLVRLAPAQACYWITTDWCPVGQFPPAGTARTCE